MLPFDLWSNYLFPLLDRETVEKERSNLLKLRSFSAEVFPPAFRELEKILARHLKVFLSRMTKFRPWKERMKEIPLEITPEYLESFQPFDFPYRVHFATQLDLSSSFVLVAARSFPRIQINAAKLRPRDLDRWNLINEHIEVFTIYSKIDDSIKLTLPKCVSLEKLIPRF
jgi:hypothetical protein